MRTEYLEAPDPRHASPHRDRNRAGDRIDENRRRAEEMVEKLEGMMRAQGIDLVRVGSLSLLTLQV